MSTVDNAMARLGRIMAADQELDVECRGMMAYATEGKVVIPSLENLDHLGPDGERMMHGYLDHECAHAVDSDFGLFKKAAERGASFKDLLNSIEDGYIEGRQGHRFRGSQWNLSRKNEWFWTRPIEKGGKSVPEEFGDPTIDEWRKFTLALTMCVRPWGGRSAEDFEDLDKNTFDRLVLCEDEIKEVRRLYHIPKATHRCQALAERIWDRFDMDSDTKNKAPKHLLLSLGAWDENAAAVLKMLKDPESAINKALQSVLAGEDFGIDCDYDGKVNPPKGDGFDHETVRGTRPYIVFSHEYDHEIDFSGDVSVSDKYEILVNETRVAADALVFAFEAALRARMEKSATYGHDDGFVDPLALAEFSVGSRAANTLYTQYTGEEDADDVAVAILVDCSGSMGSYDHHGSKAHLAAQTATALHQACATCQIEHEVSGFTTTYNADSWYDANSQGRWMLPSDVAEKARKHLLQAHAHGQDIEAFARIYQGGDLESMETSVMCFPSHAIFKRFGCGDARGISHITGIAANLDGEAVMWQARRLAERLEKRRVMFVLSDGLPSAAKAHADEHGYLKESVRRIIDAGIEVYGIGINSQAVKEFYPTYWVARNLDDLTEIAMGALIDVLSASRQERTCVTL